ncbi:MAG: hypothetical protein WA989_16580 [Henriciella sp.]|uniref:hypothetical protein n=1 Tax=Henriciella sp. TaxID=1968823 RepID=UPI003C7191B6
MPRWSDILIWLAAIALIAIALLRLSHMQVAAEADWRVCIDHYFDNPATIRGLDDLSVEERAAAMKRANALASYIPAAGFVIFLPFLFGLSTRRPLAQKLICLVGIAAMAGATFLIVGADPSAWHDCDRKGVEGALSLVILLLLPVSALVALLCHGAGKLITNAAAWRDKEARRN